MSNTNIQLHLHEDEKSLNYSASIQSPTNNEWLGNVSVNLNWSGALSNELKTKVNVELTTLLVNLATRIDTTDQDQ